MRWQGSATQKIVEYLWASPRSAIPFHDPLHLRSRHEAPFPQRTGHHVEIIHLETVGRAARVVPARDKDNVAVGHSHRFIQQAVIGIDPLHPKARGWIQAVIIGLFQISDAWVVVFVMAM